MKDLKLQDFESLIGTQVTIDNPHDELPPHTLTITGCAELMAIEDERRNPFAVYFAGAPMLDASGEQTYQGTFTIEGGVLDGQNVFISVNGFAGNDVEFYEYEAIFY